MTEIKVFSIKTATMEEWRDYHKIKQQYFMELFPDDDPVELDTFMVSEKGWLSSDYCFNLTVLAYKNGEIAGLGALTKHSAHSQVYADIIVLPEYRKKGVGSELLKKLCEEAVSLEFKTFFFFTVDIIPSGENFLMKNGAKKGIIQKGNQVLIKDLDENLMRKWVDDGNSPEYESGVWINEIPEEHLEKYSAAYNSINDAPHGDLDNVITEMTPDSMRKLVKGIVDGKDEIIIAWVRDKNSGEFAAISDVIIYYTKKYVAFQNNTLTVPKYRKNGFGKLVKALNALYLIEKRPNVRFIRTSNANVNEAMLAINEKMGFKQYQTHTFWELEVEKCQKTEEK
ncbi:MAG TPA: GNAT family N-acetyltransferase [bacterium]|nr:GNAT family N-acetyltransferase [bacterium]